MSLGRNSANRKVFEGEGLNGSAKSGNVRMARDLSPIGGAPSDVDPKPIQLAYLEECSRPDANA